MTDIFYFLKSVLLLILNIFIIELNIYVGLIQIKIYMHINMIKSNNTPAQQQYNFKVKVNYRNGAVTVHGPNLNVPASSPQTIINNFNPISMPIHPQIPIRNVNQIHQQPLPIINQAIPTNRKSYNQLGSFTNSTASQSYLPDSPNVMTKNPDLFSSQAIFHENIIPSFVRAQSETAETQGKNTIFNIEVKNSKQEQIDCVLCQRKFTSKQFQYHLQLHRNPKKRKEQTIFDPFGLNQLKTLETTNQKNFENKLQNKPSQNNSFVNQSKPELLYSFQNKNNSFGDIYMNSVQNSKLLSVNQSNGLNSELTSHHSSRILEPIASQRSSKQLIQIQSGIRYINENGQNSQNNLPNQSFISSQSINSSRRQINSNFIPQSFQTGNLSREISSVRSSQVLMPNLVNRIQQRSFHNSREHSLMRNNPESIRMPEPKPQEIKPFRLIQQQQSRVYQYFPQSGHLSLSQHRIKEEENQRNNFSHQFGQTPPFQALHSTNIQNFTHPTNKNLFDVSQRVSNNENFNQTHSQPDQSSISSIHQYRQPLESMSREQILKNYHTQKKKLDLSNIIGLSDALAREGYTSSQRVKTQNFGSIRDTPSISGRQKTLTARSIILPSQSNQSNASNGQTLNNLNKKSNNLENKNIEMIAVQGRQIFRGTQVQQDDFRGFQSVLNMTRSSKSSAKTKLPKNYLAVNDFLNSSTNTYRE